MRKIVIIFSIIFSLFCFSAEKQLINFKTFKYPSGMRATAVIIPDFPVVYVSMAFLFSNIDFPSGKEGIKSVMIELIKQRLKLDEFGFDKGVRSINALTETSINEDYGVITFKLHKEDLDSFFFRIKNVFSINAITPGEFHAAVVKSKYLSTQRQVDDEQVLSDLFKQYLFAGNSYSYNIWGVEASINQIAFEDAKKILAGMNHPDNIIISVAGDIDPVETVNALSRSFPSSHNSELSTNNLINPLRKTEGAIKKIIYLKDIKGAQEISFVIGDIGPAFGAQGYYESVIANHILGESNESRLVKELSILRGVVPDIKAWNEHYKNAGSWNISGHLFYANLKYSLNIIFNELQELGKKGMTEGELEKTKKAITNSFPLNFLHMQDVNMWMTKLVAFDNNASFVNNFRKEINAVSLERINKYIKTTYSPERFLMVCMGDSQKIQSVLGEFGEVRTISQANQ